MKGKGQPNGWITRNGVHVPIFGAYTVRGGVEPKAKGAKWGKKKRFDKASNGAPRVTDAEAKANKVVEFDGQKYQTQPVIDWDRNKNQEYVAGHLYVPVDPKPGKHQFFVANEDGSVHDSGTAYLNKKNAQPNPWKEKAEANKTSKNATTEGESAASKGKRVEGKGAVKDVKGKKYEDRDYNELADAHKAGYSAQSEEGKPSVDFSKMKYSEAGAYVAAHKKDFGLNDDDDAYQAAYEMKQGTWKGKMPGQESSTPKVSKTDAYNDKVFADFKANGKDYQRVPMEGYAGTANDFKAAAKRAGVDIEYDKGDDTFYLRKSKQKSSTPTEPSNGVYFGKEPSASEYGKAMDSINKRYDRERRTVPGKEMGKVFEELKPGDTIQVHSRWSTSPDSYVMNDDGTFDYSTPSSSFLAKKGMSLEEAQKHATNSVDNRITIMRKKSQESSTPKTESNAGKRYKTKEQNSTKLGYDSDPNVFASRKEARDLNLGLRDYNKFKAKDFGSMSLTGLKEAFANASDGDKAKIRAALQAKGYVYKGGKWIKG